MIYHPDQMYVVEQSSLSYSHPDYRYEKSRRGLFWEVRGKEGMGDVSPILERTWEVDPDWGGISPRFADPLRTKENDVHTHRGLVDEKLVEFTWRSDCWVLSKHPAVNSTDMLSNIQPPEHLHTESWTWDPRVDGLLPPDYQGTDNG